MKELGLIVRRLVSEKTGGAVLATLVTAAGSSYRRPGARLLLTAGGERLGSISGGCLEEDVLARARLVAASGRSELVVYDTTSENDLVWGVGLGCHGVVQVLLERLPARPGWAVTLAENLAARRTTMLAVTWQSADPAARGTRLAEPTTEDGGRRAEGGVFEQEIKPPVSLLVFGAGDDARPLVRAASELGWWVTVADPRAAFATKERFPEAGRVVCGPAEQLVGQVEPEPGALAVVMTHHYVHDVPLLRDLLPLPLPYLGLLGPKKRAERIMEELRSAEEKQTGRRRAGRLQGGGGDTVLHAPVGLDLGAETPEEVALAILSEMQAALTGRNALPLRERERPIHG